MSRIPEQLARALGIPATASLVALDPIQPAASDAAKGASPGQLATLALAAVVNGPIGNSPASFEELSLPGEVLNVGVSRLRLFDQGPIFQMIGPAVDTARFVGKTERRALDVVYLDAREELSVWVPGDDTHPGLVLRFDPTGRVDPTLVSLGGEDMGLGQWAPSAAIEVQPPDLGSLIGDLGCPDWLHREFAQMVETGSTFETAAAVGLIGRLWSAPTSAASSVAAREILQASGPASRARKWFGQLPLRVREALDAIAVERTHDLLDQLPDLTVALAKDEGIARSLGLAWLHRRDDLEAFAFLSRSSELRQLLSSVDRAAVCENTVWGVLGSFDDDDRLLAVSWQEPESWWGDLAVE